MPYPNQKEEMEPIAQIGQNVAIYYDHWMYYKVNFIDPVPWFQAINLGALAALASTPAPVIAPNLDLNDDEFGQWRWYPLDDAQYRLYVPGATGRYVLKSLTVPVEKSVVNRNPSLSMTEFYTWEDHRPAWTANNGTIALAQTRIIVGGFRFHGQKIEDADIIAGIQAGTIPAAKISAQGLA